MKDASSKATAQSNGYLASSTMGSRGLRRVLAILYYILAMVEPARYTQVHNEKALHWENALGNNPPSPRSARDQGESGSPPFLPPDPGWCY